MEPERKIEKWLRIYAKKRRSQAKDAFDLHPATRRLLQDEIARKGPAPEDDDDSFSIWELFRQQWAWLLVFTACIFLIATMFLPVVYKAKEKAQNTLGMAHLEQTNLDMSGAVAMNNPAPQPESSLSMDRKMVNAGNEPSPSIAPPPPAPMPEPNSISAGSVEQPQPTSASSDLAMNSASAPSAMTPPAIVTGEAFMTASTRDSAEAPAAKTAAQPQFGPGSQNNFQNSVAPSQNLPVLSNFQVQQNGNALRIVDQDGSVYVGSWRLTSQSANNGNVEKRALLNLNMAKASLQAPTPPAGALANNLQAAQNYFFRVHGMNRTLKQNVVFTGNLLANVALSDNVQPGFGGGGVGGGANISSQLVKTEQTNQVAQLPWSNLRIAGTAVINRTNHIEVNATPVTPMKQN